MLTALLCSGCFQWTVAPLAPRDTGSPTPDAHVPIDDAGRDASASVDAGTDAQLSVEEASIDLDAGIDAGRDGGSDAGHDGGSDAGRDAGHDAWSSSTRSDGGHDAALDAHGMWRDCCSAGHTYTCFCEQGDICEPFTTFCSDGTCIPSGGACGSGS
jgi:hypothetical protein